MNVLELLLQRIRSESSTRPDPDWAAHLAELEDAALPPRDPHILAPGQSATGRSLANFMHPNTLGIFGQSRPPPAGDEVIRPGQSAYAMPYMPRAAAGEDQRWFNQQINPSYFPGPGGGSRIAMRGPPGSGYDPALLSEVEGEASLPPRDPWVLAPGQSYGGLAAARGVGSGLHSNALGIYAEPRPPPAGDVVLPSGDRGLAIPWMPQASGDSAGRAGNVMTTPSYLPGPDGSTRIGWRPPPGMPLPQRTMMDTEGENTVPQPLPQGLPLGVQDAIRNQPSYQEGGQFMAPEPYYNPNIGEEVYPREDPRRRDYRLHDLRGFGRFLQKEGGPAVPEGDFLTVLPPDQSPYATRLPSALNQLLKRGPFGQY